MDSDDAIGQNKHERIDPGHTNADLEASADFQGIEAAIEEMKAIEKCSCTR